MPRGQSGLNRPHVDLLSDMTEHDNWRPNLTRLETLTEAAQMDQRDYAESWAWVYFCLNSPPERREVLDELSGRSAKSGCGRAAFGAAGRAAGRAGGAADEVYCDVEEETTVRSKLHGIVAVESADSVLSARRVRLESG